MLEELNYDLDELFNVKKKNSISDDFNRQLDELSDFEIVDDVNDIFGNKDDINFFNEWHESDFVDEKDPLEDTLKISNFVDDSFQSALDRIENERKVTTEIVADKTLTKDLSLTEDSTFFPTLEESFVSCSVLGFVTLFMGFGWLFGLLHYIAV